MTEQEEIRWILTHPYRWNLPCNYLHYQIRIKVPTHYYIDTAGEVQCV